MMKIGGGHLFDANNRRCVLCGRGEVQMVANGIGQCSQSSEASGMNNPDIIDWLSNLESQVEADGYQQNEKSTDRWYVDGPPEIVQRIPGTNEMIVSAGGELFRVTVTKKRK